MVTAEVKDQVRVLEPDPEQLNATAVQEVADILEEAEKGPKTQQPETGYWFYRMPFAGVRYYSY